jgi:hypothetical protein
VITVPEIPLQNRRQLTADGALAGPHGADKDDVLCHK